MKGAVAIVVPLGSEHLALKPADDIADVVDIAEVEVAAVVTASPASVLAAGRTPVGDGTSHSDYVM